MQLFQIVAYNDRILWQIKSEPQTKDKLIFTDSRIEIHVSYEKEICLNPKRWQIISVMLIISAIKVNSLGLLRTWKHLFGSGLNWRS